MVESQFLSVTDFEVARLDPAKFTEKQVEQVNKHDRQGYFKQHQAQPEIPSPAHGREGGELADEA